MVIALVQPIELEGPGGGRTLLPGYARQLLKQVFGGASEAEQTLAIIDVTKFREFVLLTNVTALAGTPTVAVRVYFVDVLNRRYPLTEGVGAAAAAITHSHTANGPGRSVLNLGADAAGVGGYLEVTVQYTIGGASPAATLEVEIHIK